MRGEEMGGEGDEGEEMGGEGRMVMRGRGREDGDEGEGRIAHVLYTTTVWLD